MYHVTIYNEFGVIIFEDIYYKLENIFKDLQTLEIYEKDKIIIERR